MPALESFLTIEFSLARRLEAARRKTMAPVAEEIVSAAAKDRYDIAHDIVNTKLSFEPMLAEVGDIFRPVGLSAFILGAATFRDGKVADTTIMQAGVLPEPVEHGIATMEGQFKDNGKLIQTHREFVHEILRRQERASLAADDAAVDNDESPFETIFAADLATEASRLNAAVAAGKTYVDIGSNLTTSRLTSYGYLSESMAAGIVRFQRTAVLDGVTCKFCRALHGRIFKVPNALQQLQDQLLQTGVEGGGLAGTPFPVAALAQLQGGMSTEQVEGAALHLPPSHPFCRCTMVRMGNVPPGEVFSPGGDIRAPRTDAELRASLPPRPAAGVTSVAAPALDDAAAELALAEGLTQEEAFLLLEEEAAERGGRSAGLGTLVGDEGESI